MADARSRISWLPPLPIVVCERRPPSRSLALCGSHPLQIIGSQTGAVGTCGKLYPARMRTSGLAWSGGVGRIGSIVAPILGGYLLSIGLPPMRSFLSASLIALVAATATALLALPAALDSAIRSELLPERPAGAAPRASSVGFRSPRLPHHRPSSSIHAPWLSGPNLSKMACEPTESGEGRISAQSLADARPRTGNGRPRRTT